MSDAPEQQQFEDWYKRREEKRAGRKAERRRLRSKSALLVDEELISQLRTRLPRFLWKLEGGPPEMERQRVDMFGTHEKAGYYVFIEIERNRVTSIYNVVKAWQYVERNVQAKPVLLIQVFSPYHSSTGDIERHRDQTIFVGEQANNTNTKLTYRQLGEECWPAKKGEGPTKVVDAIALLISDYEKSTH